jgi:hypothetical protein
MFDRQFFAHPGFGERLREFVLERSDEHSVVSLIVGASSGERFDVREIRSTDDGTTLITRDDHMVFLPYHHIAYVDVSIVPDRGTVGFQLGPE